MKYRNLIPFALCCALALACSGVNADKARDAARRVADGIAGEMARGNADVACAPISGQKPRQAPEVSGREMTAPGDRGLEIPAPLGNGHDLVLYRKGYTVSYNARTLQPNWVAWQLTPARLKGSTRRSDYPFTADDDVPAPRAEDADYRRSGYDRGHMCPAGDNKWNAEAMRQSFLFSNICPQHPGLNRGDWNEMEQACRRWARRYGKLYVVCGPVFYKTRRQRTIGQHRIPVPDAFFKVVLCMEGTPKAIGFLYKNTDGNRPKGDYANSVDEVERMTGIDFFPSLPDAVEKKVEARCRLGDWQ